ncbi:MAG: tryptophan synthase subunit alpha [Acidiferrobacterales bacterium]
MSRLQKRFADLKAGGRKALIPFITAGDPTSDVTVPLLHALVEAGADVLELGIPFSDPMAEGPAIQHACERALMHHVTTHDVLNLVREFRQKDNETPIVLMGYLNPIEVLGYEAFAEEAVAAGADGMITVDLPPEEAEDYLTAFHKHGLDSIFLLAPTSTDARIKQVAAAASGFVYYVSLRGVTGASHIDTNEVQEKLNIIKSATDLPIAVGFGINNAETAAEVARIADAVVVGSAIVKRIAELVGQPDKINQDIGEFLSSLRTAIDKTSEAAA